MSSTADCDLLILSSSMYSSVPYADGAPPWQLVLSSLWGSSSLSQPFHSKTGSQVNGAVCLQCNFGVGNIRHLHAASHQRYIWPSISLSTVTVTRAHSGRKCKKFQVAIRKLICPWKNFIFSPHDLQAIYLQNHKSFLGDLAYIHLFYIILSYFSLSWILVQFLEESPSSDM